MSRKVHSNVDVLRMRHRLGGLEDMVTTLTGFGYDPPAQIVQDINRLRSASMDTAVKCLLCKQDVIITIAIGDREDLIPTTLICGPCDQRTTEDVLASATRKTPSRSSRTRRKVT